MARPYRSMLYIPASKERALEKARDLPADAIIFDLEDAVLPEEKSRARDILLRELEVADFGSRARIVRINGLDTAWGRDDAAAFAGNAAVNGVLVPKVGRAADLDAVAALMPDVPLWAMMETARGMLNAAEIAAHRRLVGMVVGTNDLAREIGSRFRPDRLPLMAGLGACVLAAKAEGRVVIDGVYNTFKDAVGLRGECEQGRDMGFDGKTLIHPDQLAVANEVFAPSPEEISLAARQIAAFREARARGEGVAVLDGRIVENLHVETARRILEQAEAIAGGGE
ncbi:MAG: CoA ester lyase [Tabrizicola sp.]|uniref:HpcH/HpaI aldolase/citrate lyase family protein n=1 Tax=Tabrizicola sp. TaxID=2005166 RepID=UPI002736DBAD|nr:CoA ester lyase [Tabrizicola sp.]MDP3261855.1 CoA ester lyase [Tabrizicola sp.]MDP3649537.1 CoA ester lyase [Paracoccaceae bacterium]MDZ4068037.1 CoA ester lyase [Tabrizicola sp.]